MRYGCRMFGLCSKRLHETANDRAFDELDSNIQTQMRQTLREILSNMMSFFMELIVFGATKINIPRDTELFPQYHVPGFATMAFAMAEHFVSYSGFTGDEDPVFREDIFDAVSLLQCSMIASPGFNTSSADPTIYGVGTDTKLNQVEELRTNGQLAHQFGSGSIRYEPELGDSAYQVPVCKPEERFVATRPNTPEWPSTL
ncbi:hypothetical protein B0H14DRAFT_2617944 [Mycena olivaceomarginata]|nr:hypothetical protein B0H14DRAFT_2617944 [Mycena olivaceomarginata]